MEYGFKIDLELNGCADVDGNLFTSYCVVYLNTCPLVEVILRLKAYLNNHPDILNDRSTWIQGMGWDQTRWPGKQFPTAVIITRYFSLAVSMFNLNHAGRP